MVNAARSVMEISGQFTDEAEGLVRVSVPKAVGRFVVHPHMPEFLRRYPKVDVQLILEDRQVDLIDDNVDLAASPTARRRAWSGDSYCPLTICCVRRRSTWLSTVRQAIPMICWRTVASTWVKRRAMHAGSSPGRQGSNGWRAWALCGQPHRCALGAVLQHMGIGSLPYFTARHAWRGTIGAGAAGVDFPRVLPRRAWLLHSPTRYLPPKLRVFIDYLVECMEKEPTLRRPD
jgi:DNA-binding transcriptional LysR family regulator